MASLNFYLCLALVFLIVSRSESRPLDPNLERKNMTSMLLRQLLQRSKEHKLRFQEDDAVVDGSHSHTMRRSPGGPDPAHH
ncbi:hypothetical protein ACE6H2_010752 [Prunus campanulata]